MRRGGHEVSKDFKGSMIRLIKNLAPWKWTMIFALTVAMISAILALITPDKLSEFADVIRLGILNSSIDIFFLIIKPLTCLYIVPYLIIYFKKKRKPLLITVFYIIFS